MDLQISPRSSTIHRLILVGCGGSEVKKLCKSINDAYVSNPSSLYKHIPQNVKYTTRKPRKDEIHGRDYNFVDEYTFQVMIKSNAFKFYKQGMDDDRDTSEEHYYGTSRTYWRWAKMVVMSPIELGQLKEKHFKQSRIIFVDIPRDDRKAVLRNEYMLSTDEAEKRLACDLDEFALFRQWDYRITNFKQIFENDIIDTFVSQLKYKS